MEFAKVGTKQFLVLFLGLAIWVIVPLAVAAVWKIRKKEPVTTILIGAATFLLFALVLEKPLQTLLIAPTQLGLPEHAASRFISARPVLWAFVVGLFPGVFEETGRLAAYKTLLRKRKNRETAVSHGIGHGGFEVILILGGSYISYIVYAVMINTGAFGIIVDQVAAQAPDQLASVYDIADQLAAFSFGDLAVAFAERIFALLYHVGASILVFYACRDRKRFWLYPLAVLLHTALDFIAGLTIAKALELSPWALEAIVAAFGILTFCGAYFLLYRRDAPEELKTE